MAAATLGAVMRRLAVLSFVSAAMLTGSAAAQTQGAKSTDALPYMSNPDWLRAPNAEDLARLYPGAAIAQGLNGFARLDCKVSVDGVLFDCQVGMENPPGKGFGPAALALAPIFLMKPATEGGKPVVATVSIPINFRTYGRGAGVDPGVPLLTAVAWTEAPSYDETAAAYPPKARETRTPGRATLHCAINGGGRLGHCEAVAEEPRGAGLATAAKALAKRFRAPLALGDGHRTNGMYATLTVAFTLDMLDGKRRIGKPAWAQLPTGQQFGAAFPKPKAPLSVVIAMDCGVAPTGALTDCHVQSETPPDQGYGAAAVRLADQFKIALWTEEGLPVVGGRVHVPLRYDFK
jgi:TonB family protein